ncbi:putative L-lactate dehydrogenase, Fe-S oxidoreductase subunit YkgE [Marinobacterium lacunae]|uniref:Putative L-lactate dehydrogenase, Fe-S oxidoreductase subunit YkgE n=1 Tax=Marinobacterium lacunae TaxID=1232683 RepID=A0A081FXB5_9GAMM|nr:(Fe-S)-binding protein [Marinobacterium lacunae]KEA63170.1 putative L-lactate dehydrogenase, Fe-S oxidoreductase subunit YkgE [Marinobacterium lacunae]
MANPHPRVGLFVTCLADMFRPEVAFASVKLLEMAGFEVEVPERQTCCGQPAFNSGDRADAAAIARQTIEAFDGFEYVVGPSGSCIGMLHHYPELFAKDDPWYQRAQTLKARAFEITSFLAVHLDLDKLSSSFSGKVTYHDSCSGLRELGIKKQPRILLSKIPGVQICEMEEAETCCGFGGTFCVKYPDISNRMVGNKSDNIRATGADTLLGGDLGCLLNMAGKLKREGIDVKARHIVEVLADMAQIPAIGESDRGA